MAYSMARRNDLPSVLAKLHGRFATPYYSILTTGILMAVLVLFVDLTIVVAISTFTLVFNYSIANIAAFKLKVDDKRQRVTPLVGLATCVLLLILLFFASIASAIVGVVFLAAGTVVFELRRRLEHRKIKP